MRSIYLRNSLIQYTKWCCTSTSRKVPLHSKIQTVLSQAICRRKPFLQLIVKCWDRFTKTQGRTVRPRTWLGVHTLVSLQQPFFPLASRESILIKALWFHVVDDVKTLKYEGVSDMPPVPAPTTSYSFHNIKFCHWFAKYIAHEI